MPKLLGGLTPAAQRALLQQRATMQTSRIARYAIVRGALFAVLFVILKTVFDSEPTPIVPNYVLGFVVLGFGSFSVMLLKRKQARRALERITDD